MRTLNREQDATFVIVTHDPGIGAQCDRIVHMHDGQVIDHAVPVNDAPLLAVS
jgi:ABC-type lipoprotein export system ATPase subunit